MLRASIVAAGCAVLCLSGCGAAGQEALDSMPPVTSEASYPLFDSTSRAAPAEMTGPGTPGFQPRMVLQRILRGAAKGNARVCGWVAPVQARTRFGKPCSQWVAGLTADDRARLRRVRVARAVMGQNLHEWIVEGAGLIWPAGVPGSFDSSRFVLRRIGRRWILAG